MRLRKGCVIPVHDTVSILGSIEELDGSGYSRSSIDVLDNHRLSVGILREDCGKGTEHDISATTGQNFVENPGLHRTLLGDGLATSLAALFGAPANTTYGENTGVLALSKVYDPRVIRIAAVLAIIFSFCPKFAEVVHAMPTAAIGGVSLVLYGMISAVGVRNVVENKVDFTKSRNVIIAALILVLAIGVTYSGTGAVKIGTVSFSGLATAAIVGIALNAVLPGKDYEFGSDLQGDTSVNFKV